MNIDDVIGIKFSPMRDEHVMKISNACVTTPDNGSNYMHPGSMAYLAMGTNSRDESCPACHYFKDKCPGHPGHLKLPTHLLNISFIEKTLIMLKIICEKCGGIVVPCEGGISAIASMVTTKVKKGLTCKNVIDYDKETDQPIYCGHPHAAVSLHKKSGAGTILQELYVSENKVARREWVKVLLPDEIKKIFSRITPETLRRLGIYDEKLSPVHYVTKCLYVPPNSIRPNAHSGSQAKVAKNDINMQLNSILKESSKLGDISNVTEHTSNTITQIRNMQTTYYGLNKPLANVTDKQPMSYYTMLSGKQGYIRGSLLGARIFRVVRHFITGNPDAKLDEIYIPESLARKIPITETVTEYNIERLTKYVANGKDVYPRCLSIYKKKTDSNYFPRADTVLEYGDQVTHDLETGNIVAFCRQPTLMKSNIAGMRVIVEKDGKSINFNPNILTCFAGDFDGDEMNGYFPIDPASEYELYSMAGMNELLISNGYGSPIIGQCQDGLLGLALLTRDNVYLSVANAARMFDNTGLCPDIMQFVVKKPKVIVNNQQLNYGTENVISGRNILSALFQHINININFKTNATYFDSSLNPYRHYSETEIRVVIEKGIFLSGIIDKSSVGAKTTNGLYHRIYNKYGAKKTLDVIWFMQRIAINYLYINGYTMNINDFQITEEQQTKIREFELSIMAESELYTENLYRGNIIAPSGKTMREFYEQEQLTILENTSNFNKYIHDGIDYQNNHLYFSVRTGSKGSPNNLKDGIVSTGQIMFYGQRLKKSLAGRANHFYPRDSKDPRANGFILNSYASGYSPCDLVNSSYYHRKGIVDKALSTAESGTKYRESVSSVDSLVTNHLRCVMKGQKVRQLLYGGDGMDPRATFKTTFPVMYLSSDEISKLTSIPEERNAIIRGRDLCREVFILQQLRTEEQLGRVGYIPVNIPLIIDDVENLPKGAGIGAKSAFEMINKFIKELPRLYFNRDYEGEIPNYAHTVCELFQAYLYYALRSEITGKFTEKQLATLMFLICNAFMNNLEDPGACVGIRTSQAISEPNTQQMLDSIHGKAGGKIANFKNIMSAVSIARMKNASMEIYFKENTNVREFAKNIEILHLGYFVSKYQIFYEKHDDIVHPNYKHENKFVKQAGQYYKFPQDVTNWCIRLEFDISRVITKNITIEDVYNKVIKNYNFVHVIFDTLNGEFPIMRIYLRQEAVMKYEVENTNQVRKFIGELLQTIIRGVDGIKTAYVKKKSISVIEQDKIVNREIEYVITDGSNLGKILLFPEVDSRLTKTNNVKEMLEFYGIANTRNLVIDYLRQSVEGAYYTHYTVFADEMCSGNLFTALNRNGSAARGTSVCQLIADSAFLRFLKIAAANGTTDYINGVNSALVIGTTPKVGTNCIDVIINEQFVKTEGTKQLEMLDDL